MTYLIQVLNARDEVVFEVESSKMVMIDPDTQEEQGHTWGELTLIVGKETVLLRVTVEPRTRLRTENYKIA